MSHQIPCITDSDYGHSWKLDTGDSEESNETPKPVYRNNTHRAGVEDSKLCDTAGLCRMWHNWRDSDKLVWILHGFLMISPIMFTD